MRLPENFKVPLALFVYFTFLFNNLMAAAESFDSSGNLKVVDKNSAAALTSTQLIDDAVATIASAFPAKAYALAGTDGTNARGLKTDASGELQVDVLSAPNITIGTLPATFAEDAAHGSGDLGIPALFVRNDSNTSLTGTSGDYTPAQLDSNGFLKVTIPVNTVTFSRLEDNAAASADPGVPVLTVRRDTAASSAGTDGDYATFNTDDTGRLWVNGSGVTQPVSAASLPLPTGASTSANQTTVIGHVDGVEGLLTTIDADTGTLAGAVSGTEMQVDVLTLPALPAGTNNIGDVDVLSLIPGTGATNLGKPEDGAHTTGDTGALVLGVRNDGGSALAGTDGDYIPLSMDSSGYLRVNVAAGGAGDGAIQDGSNASIEATVLDYTSGNPLAVRLSDTNGDYVAAGAGTQYTEDAAAAADPVGSALMMVRDDALSGQTTTDGDNVAARGTDKGELYVKHVDAIPVTDNGGALTVDGTVAATQSGTWDEVGINDSGNSITVDGTVTVTGVATETTLAAVQTAVELIDDTVDTDNTTVPGTLKGALVAGTDGTNTQVLSVNADGEVGIQDGGNSITVDGTVAATQSGTWDEVGINDSGNSITVDGTITEANSGGIQTAVQLIDDAIKTDDAAFTPATTAVNMAGFEYDDTTPDSVNEGDAGAARMSANRNQYIQIRDAAGNERGVNVNASNQMSVSVDNTVTVGSHAVTNAGTFAVQAAGDVAHDTADSGNPVKIGGEARTTDPTAVATGDRVEFIADTVGKQVVLPYAIPENMTAGATAAITTTTSTSVIAAPGASIRLYITSVQISNSHASVGTLVSITDGSGGTTLAEGYAGVAGSGWTATFPVPLRLTANTALHAVCGTTGANVYVSAQGYKAP